MIQIDRISIKDKMYPTSLLQISDPPQELYIEGDSSLLNQNSIAIVGCRKSTDYGEKYAARFAKSLSKKGLTIVSGLAVGIDTIAHIHSMKELGKTIAVLGCGFDNVHLKENYYLYNQILQNGGCIITEYPPEIEELSANFPRRNRIISGLSMGVLVVEAKARSGSTITAKFAIKQKKEVFCIPNRLGEKNGYSTNLLIKNGANLVTCPEDILAFYNINQKEDIVNLSQDLQSTYDFIGQLPISANELSRITNQPIAQITEKLCILEIDGFIKSVPGNKYVRLQVRK